jgi:phosphatidylserine decarboxylase
MSFESLLIDTCTIWRYTPGVVDAYGTPTKTWYSHFADEPCRLMSANGREVQVGAVVVIADYMLMIGDVDITEQDLVTVDGINYEILLVEEAKDSINTHHKECLLRTVR